MDEKPQSESLPITSLDYFQVRIVLLEGFNGDFDTAAPIIWQNIPEVIKVGAMREKDEPWKTVLLTLDIDTDAVRAEEIASNLRRDRHVENVELISETATIWSTDAFLQTEPEAQRRPKIFSDLALLFLVYDPVGINFYFNTDEYVPEVRTVLPRLDVVNTAAEIPGIIREEFIWWFGEDMARPIDRFERLGDKVSLLWASQ